MMSPYKVALLIHLLGVLVLFMAVAVEWVGLSRLRRAQTAEQLREWASMTRLIDKPLPLAMMAVLASGIYMTALRHWTWQVDWIGLSMVAVLLMGVGGQLLNMRRLHAIVSAAERAPSGPIAPALLRQIHDPVLPTAVQTLAALAFGVVALKALRPEPLGAVATLGIAIAAGLLSAQLPRWSKRQRSLPRQSVAVLGSGS